MFVYVVDVGNRGNDGGKTQVGHVNGATRARLVPAFCIAHNRFSRAAQACQNFAGTAETRDGL